MLKLKHNWLFDQDPYGDLMDCTLIGTIGTSLMMVFYMLVPLPSENLSLLFISMFIAMGLGLCSIPIYVGRLSKLKAYLFYTIVFSVSIYGSTLFSNIPIAFIIWLPVLILIVYLPLIRYPAYIFISGLAVGVSVDISSSTGDGSIYIANMRLITFLLIMFVSSLTIVFYPQYLGYKKRVALWLCIESLARGLASNNLKDRTDEVAAYTKNMGKYQKYYAIKKQDVHLQSIAEEIQQCFLTYIYIHDNQLILKAQGVNFCAKFVKEILYSFENIISIKIPEILEDDEKEINIFKNNLVALAIKTNNFLNMATESRDKHAF